MFSRKVFFFGTMITAVINVSVMSEFLRSDWIEKGNFMKQSSSSLQLTTTTPSLVNCVVTCSEWTTSVTSIFNSGTGSCDCYVVTFFNMRVQSGSFHWIQIPSGYDGSASLDFYVKFFNGYWKTYDEANAMCVLEGARLVVIDTMDKFNLLPTLPDFTFNKFYTVAATDILLEDTFVWSTGSPVSRDAQLWHEHQPNDADGNQDCVAFNKLKYDDVTCTTDHQFICQLV